MSKLSEEASYYDILGVTNDATAEDIKRRYRSLTLKFHPDKESSSLARIVMVSINEAYEVLSDPQRRLDYDKSLQDGTKDMPFNEGQRTAQRWQNFAKPLMKRVLTLTIFIVLFSIAYLAGSQTELLHDSEKAISNQFAENTQTSYDAISHQVFLSIPMFIPGFGIIWGMLAAVSAGAVDKAVIMMAPDLTVRVYGPVLLYTTSFGMIKLLAYSVGMSRSLTLANSIWKKRCGKELVPAILDAVIVVSLLSLSGLAEHALVIGD